MSAISEESKLHLRESTEQKIEEVTKEVDRLYSLLRKGEIIRSLAKDMGVEINLERIESLVKFRLLIGLLMLDLASCVRMYLNAKFQYEGLFAAKQVIIIINEGYKAIYGYLQKNDHDQVKTAQRNKSFWIREIGKIIEYDLPELKNEYATLTKALDDYSIVDFKTLKRQRSLFVHYDKGAIELYKGLSELDIDTTFHKLILFLGIVKGMFAFTDTIIKSYTQKTQDVRCSRQKEIENLIVSFNRFKNEHNEKMIQTFQEKILNLFRSANNLD